MQEQGTKPQNQSQSGQKDQYSNKNTDTQKTGHDSSRVGTNTEKDEPRAQDRNQKQGQDNDSSSSTDKKSQIVPNKSSSS